MIEHFAPFVLDNGKRANAAELVVLSRGHMDQEAFDPSSRIVGNYEAVLRRAGKKDGGYRGWLFEVCFWDALVHYGVPAEGISHHVDVARGRTAEIDLVIDGPSVGVMLKTSLRERWAQMDRTGIIHQSQLINVDHKPIDLWAVFYREMDSHSAIRAMQQAARTQQRFWSPTRVRTVLDKDAMRELFTLCGADA